LGAPFTIVFLMNPGFCGVAAAVAAAYFFRGIGTANERRPCATSFRRNIVRPLWES
jgi:hypothetical protein